MKALSLSRAEPRDPLIVQLAQGDPRALGEVYDLHHEAVRAFCGRLVGDPSIAEDLVHEVFVALPRLASRFRGDSSLRSFVTGIAINHARHYVRSAARRRASAERFGHQPSAESRSPEADAEQSSFLRAVARALDQLPLRQRVAFVLCDVDEHSPTEAAEIAGVPAATMRTRLHHARKRLRALLDEEGQP